MEYEYKPELAKNLTPEQFIAACEDMRQYPQFPIGECFESTGTTLLDFQLRGELDSTFRICHGLGKATMPGQEGHSMAHSWMEWDDGERKCRMALDTTWGILTQATWYRLELKIEYVVEYKAKHFVNLWRKKNRPGPFDRRIREVCIEADKVIG